MKLSKVKKRKRQQHAKDLARKYGTQKTCPRCGADIEDGGHYMPPSLGEPGRWVCDYVG